MIRPSRDTVRLLCFFIGLVVCGFAVFGVAVAMMPAAEIAPR